VPVKAVVNTDPKVAKAVVITDPNVAVPMVITGATADPNVESVPGASACPEMAALGPGGISVQRKDYSIAREMKLLNPYANTTLGSISSPIYSYSAENELRSTTGSLIAKLISPTVFWDRSAWIYDCVNDKFAEIKRTSNWWTSMFNPNMRTFEIFDAAGKKVATMEEIKTGSDGGGRLQIGLKVWNPHQKRDRTVVHLDLDPYGFGKSVFGIFGKFGKATVSFIASPTIVVPPLLKDPRFLSLIASQALSSGKEHGPFFQALFGALSSACLIVFFCYYIRCLIREKNNKIQAADVIANANNEEKRRLMGPGEAGMREAQQNAAKDKGFFGGCCRRQQPPMGQGMAPV